MSHDIPYEEALRGWIAEATIPEVFQFLELVKEALAPRNLVLE